METQLACLTPPGKAAIATLAVRGPEAWMITRQFFKPHKGLLPDAPTASQFWFGKLGKDHADEVILAVKQVSPTVCLEIHCHGGVEMVRVLQELYQAHGVAVVPWQQFSDDLTIMLAQAPTARTAAILLDQANGAWQSCLQEMPDNAKVRRLGELIPLGQHLITPWKIVIAGAPNVGKSSLMNALAGYTRSIVSPLPGTTRDVVTTRLAIDGWPVEMTDTAGIWQSSSELDLQGMQRAYDAWSRADLRFWLLDGANEPIYPEDPSNWHFVINKIDLPAAWDWQGAGEALQISAQTQEGLAELCEMISRDLVPFPPAAGEAVPCLPEQFDWVRSRNTSYENTKE